MGQPLQYVDGYITIAKVFLQVIELRTGESFRETPSERSAFCTFLRSVLAFSRYQVVVCLFFGTTDNLVLGFHYLNKIFVQTKQSFQNKFSVRNWPTKNATNTLPQKFKRIDNINDGAVLVGSLLYFFFLRKAYYLCKILWSVF